METTLRELLLDEEGAEVGELPGAGSGEDDELDDDPADDAPVGGLGLIPELSLAFLVRISLFPSSSLLSSARKAFLYSPSGRPAPA